jgi:trimethylamine--corrinoid protein Co-methyltransferase
MIEQPIRLIPEDRCEQMKSRTFELLETVGVEARHEVILKHISGKGVQVDFETGRARFPRKLVEECLEMMPETVRFGDRRGNVYDLPIGPGKFYVRGGTGAYNYLQEDGQVRKTTLDDVRNLARLYERIENIEILAAPFAHDAPPQCTDVFLVGTILKNATKHHWIQPYNTGSIKYLNELILVSANGKKQMLRQAAPMSWVTCAVSPLKYIAMDLEVMKYAAEYGTPQHICSLSTYGGTSPYTIAATAILAAAEIVAGACITNLIQPGSPVIAAPLNYGLDPRTTNTVNSSVEAIQSGFVSAWFLKHAFGFSTHCLGFTTNSPVTDLQAGVERGIHMGMFPLTDVDIMGSMSNYNVVRATCPALSIIDNEIAGMCRKMGQPIDFSDEGQAWELLSNCRPGDTFLATRHSAQHCRDFFNPVVFTTSEYEQWRAAGGKDVMARAWEQYHQLMKDDDGVPFVDQDQEKEIDRILSHAAAHLTPGDHRIDPSDG